MFSGTTLQLHPLDDGLVELRFDRHGESVNKFDAHAIGELRQATAELAATPGLRGVLVTSAKGVFIVGADIFEFPPLFAQGRTATQRTIEEQSAVFTAFADLPVPTVAAVPGFALGGGLEMALACDARVLSDQAAIGLPEVTLGIVPGYGGTVRLPRLAGLATALPWITQGKPQKASAAQAAGVADAVVPAEALRDTALQWLRDAADGRHDWRARRAATRGPFALDASALAQARAATAAKAAHYPAPAAVVEHLARSAAMDAPAALQAEAELFAAMATTPTAASLVRLFLNDQALKKQAKALAKAGRPVKRVAVLGAGIMGGGIAVTAALRGSAVRLKDIGDSALKAGMDEADRVLRRQVEGGRLKPAQAADARAAITPQLDDAGFDEVDLVVEAVVENLAVKKKIFAELEGVLRPDALLASNTSSLSIADMAAGLSRPERFAGLHFFNPVPAMPLVEVIRGPQTTDAALATAAGWAAALGKTPIVVKDCPGFLVNRIMTPYLLAFGRLLHDGVDLQAIDRAMEAFGWPMGPACLSDVIGLDTLAHILDVIGRGYAPRLDAGAPCPSAALAAQGRRGQKSGAGFYRWEADDKGRPRKVVDEALPGLLATLQPSPPRPMAEADIVDRLMLPFVLEAARCLDEGVAHSAVEVDMGVVLGLGFPRHLGGPLHWADARGLAHVLSRCDALAPLSPLYCAGDDLRRRAAEGRPFHPA
jgi:3-hydroxyacyl-CoA dehydrogenase/enoyl-CoA hydratase/3-hydroxybutyryl-CoA epimerase/enoyl-CoA isomerase